ncbi:hypothetical protein [Micromonospora sp. NPDC023814]|uniref:hypothetical protein n=1 Tax=Micromonospora sp. NPDC023814 TaxID=3154596 RepID=UPI0034112CFB
MSLLRAVASELRKTATLPASLVAIGVAVAGSVGITLLNASYARAALGGDPRFDGFETSPAETAFAAVPLGVVGAVILGVVAISSEYTANSSDAGGGRQITATLTATPRRLTLLAAKAVTVVVLIAITAAVTIATCIALAHLVIGTAVTPDDTGETIARALGAALYWALMGLLALAITVLIRSGIIPLIVLIANSSLVSVSFLLSQVTPLARFLPDLAGIRLFARESFAAFDDALDPLTGGLVMAAWAFGLLAVSAVVFTRRDA